MKHKCYEHDQNNHKIEHRAKKYLHNILQEAELLNDAIKQLQMMKGWENFNEATQAELIASFLKLIQAASADEEKGITLSQGYIFSLTNRIVGDGINSFYDLARDITEEIRQEKEWHPLKCLKEVTAQRSDFEKKLEGFFVSPDELEGLDKSEFDRINKRIAEEVIQLFAYLYISNKSYRITESMIEQTLNQAGELTEFSNLKEQMMQYWSGLEKGKFLHQLRLYLVDRIKAQTSAKIRIVR
jgi:hypothetical protein